MSRLASKVSNVGAALAAVLLGGLLLRLVLAYFVFPGFSGFQTDLATFISWSTELVEHGPAGFYGAVGFVDYPPGYLYLLWAVGLLAEHLAAPMATDPRGAIVALIKVPAIVADVAAGYLLYRLARGWLADRTIAGPIAVAAAGLYLFNPITWYESALWGQVDALGALIMLAAVALLLSGHSEGAAAMAAVAGVAKPQFGVVLVPVVAAVLLRRHLLLPGSGPRPQRLPAALRDWFVEEQGPWRLVSSAAAAFFVFLLLIAPFSLDLPGYVSLVKGAAELYPRLSVNAFNPWALVGTGGIPPLAVSGEWSDDRVPLLGPFPGLLIGSLLLLGAFLAGFVLLLRSDDKRSIVLTTIFLSLAFFVLPTRVHERYIFPAFAFLPLLAVTERRWLVGGLLLAGASFINLHGVLTKYSTENIAALPLGEAFRSPPAVVLSVLGHVTFFAFVAWRLRRASLAAAGSGLSGLAAGLRAAFGRVGVGAGGIGVVLLGGLALRLAVAYVLFPGSGFQADLGTFTSWSLTLAEHGPWAFYRTATFIDYPPALLYVLWLLGLTAQLLSGVLGAEPVAVAAGLVKVPAILADLAVAYLLYTLARRWLAARPGAERLGLAAASLYLFNPVTWYDSALWGQVDAFGALLVLGAVGLLVAGHSEWAIGMTVLAALAKPQFGIVLAPLVAAVLLRRHLLQPGSGPPQRRIPLLGDRLAGEQGPIRLVSSAAVGLAVLVALTVPFALGPVDLVRLLASTAAGYPWLSVNAYNPWALVGAGGQPSLAEGGGWSSDQVPLVGSLPGVVIGSLLLALGFLGGFVRSFRREGAGPIVVAAVFFCLAFFLLPTRVHERYVFPAFAFLPLLAVLDRRWLVATAVLTAASFVNLHGVLTIPQYGTANVVGLPLGESFRTFPWVLLSVVGHVGVFAFAALQLTSGRDPVARHLAAAAAPRAPVPVAASARAQAESGGIGAAVGGAELEPGRAGDLDAGGATASGLLSLAAWRSLLTPVTTRLGTAPLRADLSGALDREPPGRLDRLDLLVLVLVVLSTFTLRTWRLEEPYEMHFDEVYHARTATEFLQDWRYRIPHDIYEYTHPHLAKYLIAAGLVVFGNDRVTGESDLGSRVAGAALERRWSNGEAAGRNGDRLYVATGTGLRAYDLRGRGLVADLRTPAVAVAVDETRHALYLADADGGIWTLPTSALDALRSNPAAPPPSPSRIGDLDAAPRTLAVTSDGGTLVALLPDGGLNSVATESGQLTGTARLAGAEAILPLPRVPRVVAEPARVRDPAGVATLIAQALGQDASQVRALLEVRAARVVLSAFLDEGRRSAVEKAIQDVEGVTIESEGAVAVADASGLAVLDGPALQELARVALAGPATGLALVEGLDKPTLYVATGFQLELVELAGTEPPRRASSVRMPAAVRQVTWDPSTNLVHALGRAPRGTDETVYVIEPHGNAVFADARLPFAPVAWALDAQPERPAEDRQELIALDGEGKVAVVDVGSHAFAWRLPGVIAGSLTAGVLYLLGRLLFRRRAVALIAAGLTLVDGMFFANARIAMNDTYVAFFIVAAYALFAALYLGRWRGPAALLLGLPAVGVLAGLALASKWVGAYAIGGLLLLVLLRSGLGRILALAGMIAISGVLGYLAISAPAGVANPQRNLLFLVLLIGLTVLLAVAIVVRPVQFTREERRFASLALVGLGVAMSAGALLVGQRLPAEGPLVARNVLVGGVILSIAGVAVHLAPRLAARARESLLPADPSVPATELDRPSTAPAGWLGAGWAGGIPWLWGLLCLTVIPLAVYVLSYVPWAQPWHAEGPRLAEGWPLVGVWPPGHTGQGFLDLQKQMYDYHNNLRATHAASSPWWAWPLDLKPVWFYSGSFANGRSGLIYDAGNLVAFWLAIPAVAWAAWQAWRRRSLSLTLVVLAIACLWLPWARIDRASFQYHIFTTLPFAFLALGYFLAELWHGPARTTWAVARTAGAVAIVAVPFLWLARAPLCAVAGTERVLPGGQACGAVAEDLVLTQRAGVSLAVLAVGLGVIVWQWRALRAERAAVEHLGGPGAAPHAPDSPAGRALLVVTGAAIAVALGLTQLITTDDRLVAFPVGTLLPYLLAGLALVLVLVPAGYILQARDPRRFTVVALAAAALWFVAFYPYLAALPIPSGVSDLYRVLPLPTYNYDFQFAVNTDPPFQAPQFVANSVAIAAGVAALTLAAMYAAHAWRLELARRRIEARERAAREAAES